MTSSNRGSRLAKLQKVLKKHYKPLAPPERLLLEHLLYATCLENAPFEAADEAFARLQESYFDWNEVRVTTHRELAEVMSRLPDASHAAQRLKRVLQSIFETNYSFDLEAFKKQNLGKATGELGKYPGVTSFSLAYVTQNGLGGHAIAANKGVFDALVVVSIISPSEAHEQRIPGLERMIPKPKGAEFFSLLHQLGVDFATSPFSPRVRGILLEIDPEAKDRLPKRAARKASADAESPAAHGSSPAGSSKAPPAKPGASKDKRPGAKKSEPATPAKAHAESNAPKSPTKRLSRKKPR